jgi:hypothetical protein
VSSTVVPWLILVAGVVATLYFRGWLTRTAPQTPAPAPRAFTQASPSSAPVAIDQLDARTLGIAFATASKREGERKLIEALADHFDATNKGIFAAPFAVPAQPTPPAAGSNP